MDLKGRPHGISSKHNPHSMKQVMGFPCSSGNSTATVKEFNQTSDDVQSAEEKVLVIPQCTSYSRELVSVTILTARLQSTSQGKVSMSTLLTAPPTCAARIYSSSFHGSDSKEAGSHNEMTDCGEIIFQLNVGINVFKLENQHTQASRKLSHLLRCI